MAGQPISAAGAQTSTNVSSSGKTGTVCQRSGPYRCNTHTDFIVFVTKGAKFPSCPRSHSTTWSVVRDS